MVKPSNTKVIGITGGIGSGKSLISSLFQSLSIPTYNSDLEAKNLYKNDLIREQVTQLFGSDIYNGTELNREVLGQIVFNDKQKLEQLNQLIHPEVKKHFENWVNSQTSAVVMKEAAILIESGAYKSCDGIITVSCAEEIRIKRVMKRDKVSRELVMNRINKQLTDSERAKHANWVILNDESTSVIQQVYKIYSENFRDLITQV